MTKQLFRKKNQVENQEGEEEKTAVSDMVDIAPKREGEPSIVPEVEETETTRLSCDIRRSHHRALRIAAANCDRSITDMLEMLIEVHLLNREINSIIDAYHKTRVKSIRVR